MIAPMANKADSSNQTITLPQGGGALGEPFRADCVYRKLNPDVVVMKSAEDRSRFDGSNPLNHARNRRVFI
jgi:hypothetical protein